MGHCKTVKKNRAVVHQQLGWSWKSYRIVLAATKKGRREKKKRESGPQHGGDICFLSHSSSGIHHSWVPPLLRLLRNHDLARRRECIAQIQERLMLYWYPCERRQWPIDLTPDTGDLMLPFVNTRLFFFLGGGYLSFPFKKPCRWLLFISRKQKHTE